MRALTLLRRNSYHLALLAALLAALLFKGLSLTPDSNVYIQGAIQLAHSMEYRYFQGASILLFPPGTSVAYLLFYQLIKDITLSVYMVNITALILTYILLLRLFERNRLKSTLAITLLFPFFCTVNSESIWIPLLIVWLIKIKLNPTFYNPLVSAVLLLTRYASIVPLNCYYATMVLFDSEKRMIYLRYIIFDSMLFLLFRRLVGGSGGHSFGLGIAKYNFAENILTAYSSFFGLVFSHLFWQLTKPFFIPILLILLMASLLVYFRWIGLEKQLKLTITFINLCIVAQAMLLSLTYVWDSNGIRYNFWIFLPALAVIKVERTTKNLALFAFLILSAITFSIKPWERVGRVKITNRIQHPYLTDKQDFDFQMNTYKWEEDAR